MVKNFAKVMKVTHKDVKNAKFICVTTEGRKGYYRFFCDGRIGFPGVHGSVKFFWFKILHCVVGKELKYTLHDGKGKIGEFAVQKVKSIRIVRQ